MWTELPVIDSTPHALPGELENNLAWGKDYGLQLGKISLSNLKWMAAAPGEGSDHTIKSLVGPAKVHISWQRANKSIDKHEG